MIETTTSDAVLAELGELAARQAPPTYPSHPQILRADPGVNPGMRASDHDPHRPRDATEPYPAGRRLSDREREIALLVADGLTDAVIARRLGLTLGTVRSYVRHIRLRLGLASRAEVAAWVQARRNPDDPTGRLRRVSAP